MLHIQKIAAVQKKYKVKKFPTFLHLELIIGRCWVENYKQSTFIGSVFMISLIKGMKIYFYYIEHREKTELKMKKVIKLRFIFLNLR